MRCALVSTEVAGFHHGGIGTYVVEAGRALTLAGHEVWLVTKAPPPEQRAPLQSLAGFARVVFAEDVRGPKVDLRFALAHDVLWFAQRAFEALRQADVLFDYVEFADYGANGAVTVPEQRLFGSLGDAVVAVVLHSPTYECWHHNRQDHVYGPELREVAALEHATIRQAPLCWSPSQRLRELVCSRLGMDAARVPIVRYPMALPPPPEPPAPRRRLQDLKFLYCGRIEPRKGVREIVAAFRELPELSIDCIGRDGPTAPLQTSEVAWLKRQGAPNVRFLPPLPRADLLQRLAAADVVVLPSPWDNWPNACLEAMAMARVVVGGRNGGMGEMIESGRSGFLCDGADASDLARVLRDELGAALPHLDAIGRAAAARARDLADPAHYTAAIEQMVAEHRGRGRLTAVAAPRATKVSVVVPYHCEDRALVGEAIDSAVAQTHRDLEILLVDDGSSRADAAEILQVMAAKDPRVQVLRKPNGGLASARNFAIERASGDLLLFLDADNVLRPDYAATGIDVFARCPTALAMVPRHQVFDAASRRSLTVVQPLPYDRALALFRNSLGDAGAMFRRAVFHEHGLRYDPLVDCYSDWALWLDLAGRGLAVQQVPRVLYDYRMRPDSMMAEQAWGGHLALLGLLIERHLPAGDATTERELLTTLAQGWGTGALLAALGQDARHWREPAATARRLQGRLRDRLAQALGQLADASPLLRRLGHLVFGTGFAIHGRYKDWRRDRSI